MPTAKINHNTQTSVKPGPQGRQGYVCESNLQPSECSTAVLSNYQGTFTRPYGWEGPSRLPCPPGLACGKTAQRERLLGQTSQLSDSVYGPVGKKCPETFKDFNNHESSVD